MLEIIMLDALISVKTKNELIGDVIMLLQSPAKSVIGALQSGGTKIHGVLETLSKERRIIISIINLKINKKWQILRNLQKNWLTYL